jgi:hypothetical protein
MRTQSLDEHVSFIHRTFSSAPVLSTFREAVRRSFLRSIPGFKTLGMIPRHPPQAFETRVGHLVGVRQFTVSAHSHDASNHEAFLPPIKTSLAEKFVQISFHGMSGDIAFNRPALCLVPVANSAMSSRLLPTLTTFMLKYPFPNLLTAIKKGV